MERTNELELLSFILSRKKASELLPNHYYWYGIGNKDIIHKSKATREANEPHTKETSYN